MKNYLLTDTSEAVEMRHKLKDMFLSNDSSNLSLAFQLLKGGGLHPELVPYIWLLPCSENNKVPRRTIKSLLKKQLSVSMYKFFEETLDKHQEIDVFYNLTGDKSAESWATEALRRFNDEEETKPHIKDFALAFLHLAKAGGAYIMKQKLLPDEAVVPALIDANRLSFANFRLPYLPACVGEYKNLVVLDLTGNPLLDVPDSFENLKNIQTLHLTPSDSDFDITEKALAKLEQFFPRCMASHYKKIGWRHSAEKEYQESIEAYKKSLSLDEQKSAVWNDLSWAYSHTLQFEKAFEASAKAIEYAQDITQKAMYLSNHASDLQRAGYMDKCTVAAQKVIDLFQTIPEKNWQSTDFFSYALASQICMHYDVALAYYDKFEQNSSYIDDGSLYYNRACIYAKRLDKERVVEMLRNALKTDEIDWIADARQDVDFQAYWEDPILDELQKEAAEGLPF